MSFSSSTSSDSNIYIATADSNDYLINPIDWNNITTHGVKDNSIPGSKIISIPVSKIVGDLPGGASKADVDAANLSTSNITAWQKKLQIDTLDALVNTKQDKLTAGTNITISGNTISSTGTKYTAGTNISISDNNAISVTGLSKSSVGLGNVDNTSDANKPISTATQTALDALVNTKQDKQDNSLKTTSKTVVGAINENFDKVQNIFEATSEFTGFNGTISTESIMTNDITPYKIVSDGSIPVQIAIVQSTGNINHNGNICFGNRYYEELDSENHYKVNTNGALGWYVWKRVFIDENGTEILPNSNITITNVKLKYATGRVLTSNNISIKFSDWQYFQKAFNNKSVVINATRTIADGRSNYVVKYYQLSSALKVTKVGDLYQFTYDGVSFTVTHVSNYKFKATSTVDPSIEVECIAQVKTLAELVNDANFAVIVPNTTSSDGTYTVNFSVATSDDHFLDGSTNITSNNGKSTSDADFIPTLNWNSNPTVANINKCKLYLSNKQATVKQFTDNDTPTEDPGNLFTNLDNYTGELGNFSYTQNSHYTGNLIHESHEYKDGYNTMILEYQPQRFGDSNNTNIVKLFSGEYGDEDNNIRSWDTSLRVTTNPELGCVQIFNFSYAEGFGTVAAGGAAHAEGKGCGTYEDFSHVEGSNNVNIGYGAHVEGWNNTNYGYGSHVEGGDNLCTVNYGHVEGVYNTVNGYGSHAEGYRTIASSQYQHVSGKWNIEDTEGKYAFIIGNGTTNERRSNAFTVDWNGGVAINNSLTTNTITCSTIQNNEKLTLSSPNSIDLYSDTGNVNITAAGTLGLSAGTKISWTGNGSYINPTKLSAAEAFEIYATNDIHIDSDVGNVSINGQTVSIYGNNSAINLSTSKVNFTGNASFPQDKFIEFYTPAESKTTTYGTSASFSDDGGGNVTIGSEQAKLWNIPTGNSLTLTSESIDIMDSTSTHTTIKPRVIQVGQNNWASTLGYAKLDISGDGIDDALNYDSISTTHSNIHRIKLPKGNIEDGTSFIIWVGTQAQYTALTTKDPSTMYFIIGTDGTVTTKFGV